MSLKCMIDKWLHKGQISQEEYNAVIKKLDGHDANIEQDAYMRGYDLGYSKGQSDGRFFGRADREKELLMPYDAESIEELVSDSYNKGRADGIDEYKTDVINKINFEDKWLFDCKSNNADTNIAFGALRAFCINKAEQMQKGAE